MDKVCMKVIFTIFLLLISNVLNSWVIDKEHSRINSVVTYCMIYRVILINIMNEVNTEVEIIYLIEGKVLMLPTFKVILKENNVSIKNYLD